MLNDNGSFLLDLFDFFVFFAWSMCLFWIIFVIVIPWLGILVYVIARGKGMQDHRLEQHFVGMG